MPSTPQSQLKRSYQKEIARSGLRIKVVERSGITLKSKLQVSNPFKPQRCGRDDCFVCSSEGTGNCNTEGITYEVKCLGDCAVKDLYKGESARNAYTRGHKHMSDLKIAKKSEEIKHILYVPNFSQNVSLSTLHI